ncbi:MAG: B3/4 domain-containing protein [Cypionkella sp.]|nr:B3/4 domain-containing protein [Cypionkella sp.]
MAIDPGVEGQGLPAFHGAHDSRREKRPAPEWLAQRLEAIGLRPISALVDITNYFTFDLNRPLHVFDAAKVSGDLRIVPAQGGEAFLALDGKTYTARAGKMVICDGNGRVKRWRDYGRRDFGRDRGPRRTCSWRSGAIGTHDRHAPRVEDQLRMRAIGSSAVWIRPSPGTGWIWPRR